MILKSTVNSRIIAISLWLLLLIAIAAVLGGAGHGLQQALFNSDSLYLPALYKDIFVDHRDMSGWMLPPAPYFFPDMPVFFLLNYIVDDFRVAAMLYAFAQSLALACAIGFLLAALAPGRKGQAAMVAAMAGIFVTALSAHIGIYQYIYLSAHHMSGAIVSLLLIPVLSGVVRQGRGWGGIAVISVVGVLMGVSDMFFLAQFLLPAAMVAILLGRGGLLPWRKVLAICAVSPVVLAVIEIRDLVLGDNIVQMESIYGLNYMQASLTALVRSFEDLYNSTPILPLACLAPVWLAGMALIVRDGGKALWNIMTSADGEPVAGGNRAFAALIFLIVIGINTALVVVNNLYVDISCWRYLQLVSLLPLVYLALLAVNALDCRLRLGKALAVLAVCLVFIVQMVPRPQSLSRLARYYPPRAQCMDQYADTYGITFGFSDYWNAKRVMMFSTRGVLLFQLEPTGEPSHWINNTVWLDEIDRSERVFFMTEKLQETAIIRLFGQPQSRFVCMGSDVLLYEGKKARFIAGAYRESMKQYYSE